MNPGAAFRKELRHGTGWVGRLEQLDVDIADMQADDRCAVRALRPSRSESQDVAVERQGVTNAGYGYADVGDRRVHTGKLTS